MTERVNRRQAADPLTRPDESDDTPWIAATANAAAFGALTDALPSPGSGDNAHDQAAIRQVVFIDGNVPDARLLANGVGPGVMAVILEPASDGVQQIAAWLVSHAVTGLSAIDIVAHGADGAVVLGNAELDSATLGQYKSALAATGAALKPGGDIQIYGCDVAQDATGVAFLDQLSAATGGASVAAASHLVGAASGGGSWNLDANIASVDPSTPFTSATMSAYADELALTTSQLFVAFAPGLDNGLTRIEQIGVTGATSGTVISDNGGTNYIQEPMGLAIDAPLQEYFYVDFNAVNNIDLIGKGSLGGGAPTTIYSQSDLMNYQLGDIALDQPNGALYFGLGSDAGQGVPGILAPGIYKLDVANDAVTAVATTSDGSVFLPTALALDLGDNLVFFTDTDTSNQSIDNLDVANTSNGWITILNSQLSAAVQNDLSINNFDEASLSSVAVDIATHTLFFTANDVTTCNAAQDFIFSVPYTVTSGNVTLGSVSTLYSGAAADQPTSLALDTQHNILYIGSDIGSGGDGNVYEGSMTPSSGASLTPVYQENTTTDAPAYGLTLLSAPSVVATGSLSYIHNAAPIVFDSGATVSNADGQNLAGATVAVAGGTSTDGDTLAATVVGNISESYDSSNETLTLSGNDTLADYQQVLDSATFSSTGATDGPRTIDWTVTDGVITSPTATSAVTVLCFCAGTLIATPNGEVPVERLSAGDRVVTATGAVRPIVWVGAGRQLVTRGKRSAATPVIVAKGALGPNLPHQDLHLTNAHALAIDDVLIPVEFLVNHRSIRWDDRAQEVALYHIELESHDVLLANGAPAESYRDDGNRWLFQNASGGWSLPPPQPCAPVLTGGEKVDAAWRRFLDMSGPRRLPPLTEDPDLHLLADGQRIEPVTRHDQVYVFRLPDQPAWVHIASRDAVPAELGLARDARPLGIALRRIVLRRGTRFSVVEAADGRLTSGFHDYEPAEDLRWTNGDAVLPDAVVAQITAGTELVLHLGGATRYPLLGEERRCVA